MKKLLAAVLALLLALSGAAMAEDTAENTNLGHMLELCQRIDLLVRSDRMVSDWVQGTDSAIAEEQKMVSRLRAGDRSTPSAVYYVTGEEMKRAFIGENADYTDSEEQRQVLQGMPLRILMEQMDEYQSSLFNNLARSTAYETPEGEPDMGMYLVLYADALPMMGVWTAKAAGVNDLSCVPVLSDALAACQSAEEVSAWFERVNMPTMTCTAVDLTNAQPCTFAEDPFADAGEPLAFETLAEVADALDAMIADRYLQTAWGASDEAVASIVAYAHNGASPRAIYRLDLMGMQQIQMIQLLYRAEAPQVVFEALSTYTLKIQQNLFLAQYQSEITENVRKYFKTVFPDEEETSEDGGKLYSDETDSDDAEKDIGDITPGFEEMLNQLQAHYTLLQYAEKSQYALHQPEHVSAGYVLLYDSGAPITIFTAVENGVTQMHANYLPSSQLSNAQNVTDVMMYLSANSLPIDVTEILPRLTDAAESAQ